MAHFSWDTRKEWFNVLKHRVDFSKAALVFNDPHRRVLVDLKHSGSELRYFCIGKVDGRILTVRFSYRGERIRIFGAGYWRKGRRIYEKKKEA